LRYIYEGWSGSKFTSLTVDDAILLENFHQEVGNICLSLMTKNVINNESTDSFNSSMVFTQNNSDTADNNSFHSLRPFCPDLLYEHIRRPITKENINKNNLQNFLLSSKIFPPEVICNYFFGVCMIADISGFSNLSSSLCKKGKSGLDKLHLNTKGFIGQLVDVVYYYGGDGK